MPKGVKGSSPTFELAVRAAKSRAYYAAHKETISWRSNVWNRAHREEGRVRSRAWSKNNPEKARQARNAWVAANRERNQEIQKAWHAKHPGYNAAMSLTCIRRQQEKEAGRAKPKTCEVCYSGGKICFDHCHTSNKFRGWLCFHCNLTLGLAIDNAKLLRLLAVYLEKPLTGIAVSKRLKPKRREELLGLRPLKCDVCKSIKRICLDHCHEKKMFRGWLCNRCNSILGHVKDDPKLLCKS
jgi:Recombination endonuclease VII